MTRLSSHFRNQADEARVARVWATLDARFEQSARRRPLQLGLSLLAACVAAGLFLFLGHQYSQFRRANPQLIELADGSRVEHSSEHTIEIAAVTPERVELRMARGRARFRVAKNPKRAFLTRAGGYTIRVVGTEYAVDVGTASVRVEVSHGEVEVRRDGSADVWRVHAGEVWSSSRTASASGAHRDPPASPAAPRLVAPPAQAAKTQPTTAADPAVRPSTLSKPNAQSSSAALFQQAQEARVAGRRDETARLLAEFVQRFPSDPRAGLAAFELGRLRLDAGDAKGAIEALSQAERAGAALGEQVQARRVQALEQLGDLASCRAARATFLARFPGGTFAEVVRRRCP
jgi:FecR protein/Tetratricopeptide repeat